MLLLLLMMRPTMAMTTKKTVECFVVTKTVKKWTKMQQIEIVTFFGKRRC